MTSELKRLSSLASREVLGRRGARGAWVSLLSARSAHGSAHAELLLAIEYSRGALLEESAGAELQLLKCAACRGNAIAQNRLACLYLHRARSVSMVRRRRSRSDRSLTGNGIAWDCTARCSTARDWRHIAEQGCHQCSLRARALLWWELASERGCIPAMLNSALVYLSLPERGLREVNQSINLLHEAASIGSDEALFRLGGMYQSGVQACGLGETALLPPDKERARAFFEAAAQKGHGRAALEAARAYIEEGVAAAGRGRGRKGWQEQAMHFLVLAAERGMEDAQMLLAAWFLEGGRGVERDERKALHWYQTAAEEHSNSEAQSFLGLCYELGDIVTEDLSKALSFYRSAAEQGHPEAQFSLGEHANSFREAVRWYTRAADQNHANALWKLSVCYRTGEHTPVRSLLPRPKPLPPEEQQAIVEGRKDLDKAADLLSRAAACGSIDAIQCLALIALHGNSDHNM